MNLNEAILFENLKKFIIEECVSTAKKFKSDKIVNEIKTLLKTSNLDEEDLERRLDIVNEKYDLSFDFEDLKELCLITKPKENKEEMIVLMSKFSPVPYAKKLMEENKFLYDKYKRFWRYDKEKGVWQEDADKFIKHKLRINLMGDEQQKKYYTEEVVSYIKDSHYDSTFEGELEPTIIPFENCLYDIKLGGINKFNPKYFITGKLSVKLDFEYKECPKIDKFFTELIGEKYKTILYELCAYCMYKGGYPYQKIFFIIGSGKEGKSTYLEFLREFLGIDNVSSVSPHDLIKNTYAMSDMWNKSANISSDISYSVLNNVNKLKEISGGDTVRIERKYKDAFPAKLYAKQIFSTNQLPIVEDKTYAFYRRIYLIEFPNKIKNPRPQEQLLAELTEEKELMGFAWKCMECLKNLYKRGFVFTYDIDVEKVAELYDDLSNPLNKFLRENTEEDAEGHIFKFELVDTFQEWLKTNKFRIWTKNTINKELKGLGYGEGQRNAGNKFDKELGEFVNKRYWAWCGLKWSKSQKSLKSQGLNITSTYIVKILEDSDSCDSCVKDSEQKPIQEANT